jgi:hypothetical protein
MHVHMKGRGRDYLAPDDISPITVVSKLVLVLKIGTGGDVVFWPVDYSSEPLCRFFKFKACSQVMHVACSSYYTSYRHDDSFLSRVRM